MLLMGMAFLFGTNAIADAELKNGQMSAVTYAEWETKRLEYLPKIVVVDMWAMWCVSCIERFPEMVKLHNKYKDKNVEFVSMNLDDREDGQSLELAEKFLHKMSAKFEHYRMDENLLYAFEKMDLIGIPAVLIYDSQGLEQYRLTGDNPNKQFTEKDVEDAINALLDQA